jgi:hypothetical protein
MTVPVFYDTGSPRRRRLPAPRVYTSQAAPGSRRTGCSESGPRAAVRRAAQPPGAQVPATLPSLEPLAYVRCGGAGWARARMDLVLYHASSTLFHDIGARCAHAPGPAAIMSKNSRATMSWNTATIARRAARLLPRRRAPPCLHSHLPCLALAPPARKSESPLPARDGGQSRAGPYSPPL